MHLFIPDIFLPVDTRPNGRPLFDPFSVVFLVPTLILLYREGWIAADLLILSLGIILCLPLARIGFAPIALHIGRHR